MEQISRRGVLTAVGGLGSVAALAACAQQDDAPSLADEPSTTFHRGSTSSESSGSFEDGSSASSTDAPQGLTDVELDPPEELRNRWAAVAAAWVGAGLSSGPGGPRAEGGDWVYEMELSQWAYLVRRKDGRAVLVGQSDPDTSREDDAEAKARAALVAGAPSWWKVYEKVVPRRATVGFILGWDGKRWQQVAAAPSHGGFHALTFYPGSRAVAADQLVSWGTKGKHGYSGSSKAPADAILKAGPKVTADQLTQLGPGMKAAQLDRAVKAARGFAGKGKH